MKTFEIPTRAWINAPSTRQTDHENHGKVGIAFTNKNGFTELLFSTGATKSIKVGNPNCLETINSQADIFKIKDNPVPSLDTSYRELFYHFKQDFIQLMKTCHLQKNKSDEQLNQGFKHIITSLMNHHDDWIGFKEFQNGRETDKEQPMQCKSCNKQLLPDDYYNFACPHCGEYQ